jgi:drug/metabolite transporter (DMT)-like permease
LAQPSLLPAMHVVLTTLSHRLHLPHPHIHFPHLGRERSRIAAQIDAYLDRVHIPVSAVLESLAGALCYAGSSVLQQSAAAEQPPELSMRVGLLVRLLRSPRWMLGNLADVGGYLFQFLALRRGALALVTPIFVIGLVFSIVGNALAQHRRPTRRELVASSATVIGLAVFIAVAEPGPGHPRAAAEGWIALFAVTIVISGGSVLLAKGSRRRRALGLALATGVLYGVTSAVTEHTGYVLDRGALHTLTTWAPYVLAVISIVGLLVNQSAYQAGDLRLSLPTFTVLEPIVAILIGQFLFGEHIASGVGATIGESAGLVVMVVGVFWLAGAVPDEVLATGPTE